MRISISPKGLQTLETLREKTGAKDVHGVINEAFALYEAAVEATEQGREVAFIDSADGNNQTIIRMRGLDYVAFTTEQRKPKAN